MTFILYICTYAMISAFGLYKLKATSDWVSIDFFVGLLFYGFGFLMWIYILRIFPLSIAFPIAAGSLVVATQLISYLLLKEPFSQLNILGIILIVIGIGITNWPSR
jgi:multidrug transporter EmrE-like cation transporter